MFPPPSFSRSLLTQALVLTALKERTDTPELLTFPTAA